MKKKILCIDDSPTIRLLVKKALESEEYEILESENGQAGLDICKGESVSLFIVDINMPVMDGFEFVNKIKQIDAFQKTPIIFLTTENAAEKKQMGKELGTNGWVVKPFDPPSLRKVIQMLL